MVAVEAADRRKKDAARRWPGDEDALSFAGTTSNLLEILLGFCSFLFGICREVA